MRSTGWEHKDDGLWLYCHIQPSAKKNEFAGLHGERIKIRLAAPPVDGQANKKLIFFLAEELQVSKSQIEIVRGHNAREKTILISGPVKIPDLLLHLKIDESQS